MKKFKFSRDDLILIFYFLGRFVEKADTLDTSEEKLMVCLLHMLTETVEHKYRSRLSANCFSGLYYCPKAVQYS